MELLFSKFCLKSPPLWPTLSLMSIIKKVTRRGQETLKKTKVTVPSYMSSIVIKTKEQTTPLKAMSPYILEMVSLETSTFYLRVPIPRDLNVIRKTTSTP